MYIYPVSTTNVSDDFAAHVARGSVNPGTDYTAAYGSPVSAVAAGVVTDTDGNPDGSGGRMVHVDNDDGTGTDYLHLSALSVSTGDRIEQGGRIGYSGASGYGENYYYGPHLHLSFRPVHGHAYTNTGNIDFDALMKAQGTAPSGGSSTPIQEDDMSAQAEAEIHAIWEWLGGGKATTVLYDLQQATAKVKAVTDQLDAGQGLVHKKLDQITYVANDPGVGIRTRVASIQAELTKIEAELSAALASLPKSTT